MAYVSKEKKQKIQKELKERMPSSWKWSLSVRNHSTLVLTIWSAPIDLCGIVAQAYIDNYPFDAESMGITKPQDHHAVKRGHYNLHGNSDMNKSFPPGLVDTFNSIKEAMNTDNHNNSDIYTDYFDVGHYVEICLGRWDKAFINTAEAKEFVA